MNASHRALVDLVELNVPVDAAIKALATAAAEDGPQVAVSRMDVVRSLDRYLSGDLSENDLERWAEAIHTLDEIDVDIADHDVLVEALFEMSTPELFGNMPAVARKVRSRLVDDDSPH